MRRQITRLVLRVLRKLFGGTAIRDMRLTRQLHKMVFRFGCSSRSPHVTSVYRGLRLTGPAHDFSIVHQVFAGYYEEVEVALFEGLASRSRVIIDVGANIGIFSCVGAAKLPEDGRMIAFEPIAENVHYLKENLSRNGLLEKADVEAVAVGESNGSVQIYLSEGIGYHSVAPENAIGWSRSLSVPVVSIDAYLSAHKDREVRLPDLIKIDAEGYDGFVLRGATDTLEHTPTLLIEYNSSGLVNCGFSTAEFLDIIFTRYHHVFLIYKLNIRRCTRDEIAERSKRPDFIANLLATNDGEHLEVVETAIGAIQVHA